jgi:uncharacterized protein (TIGR02147 family)
MSLFQFDKYRDVINYQIKKSGSIRGYLGQLAQAAGSQSSHISQVLHGAKHLTIEQSYGLARFWHFDADATSYFIALVQRERSTNRDFSSFLTEEIKKIRTRKAKLSDKINSRTVKPNPIDSRYYASWLYPSVHVMISIPKLRSIRAIATKLKVPEDIVEKAVTDLENMGLVQRIGSALSLTQGNIHLDSASPLNIAYHNIWRNFANQRMQHDFHGQNIHFTSLFSLSETDFNRLKEMVLEFVHSARELVLPSTEETIACFTCDFFEL